MEKLTHTLPSMTGLTWHRRVKTRRGCTWNSAIFGPPSYRYPGFTHPIFSSILDRPPFFQLFEALFLAEEEAQNLEFLPHPKFWIDRRTRRRLSLVPVHDQADVRRAMQKRQEARSEPEPLVLGPHPPCSRRGWEAMDTVNLQAEFRCRVRCLQGVPSFFRGQFRALVVSLEVKADFGQSNFGHRVGQPILANPFLAKIKPRWPKMDWPKLDWPKLVKSGWPKRDWPKSVSSSLEAMRSACNTGDHAQKCRWKVFRLTSRMILWRKHQRGPTKVELERRMDLFHKQEWVLLSEEARQCATGLRRKPTSPEEELVCRGRQAEKLVQGEVSRARQALCSQARAPAMLPF